MKKICCVILAFIYITAFWLLIIILGAFLIAKFEVDALITFAVGIVLSPILHSIADYFFDFWRGRE